VRKLARKKAQREGLLPDPRAKNKLLAKKQDPRRPGQAPGNRNKISVLGAIKKEPSVATKGRLMAMAAAHCAVCSGAMVLTLAEIDPTNGTLERRSYACADCGHSRTYSVDAVDGAGSPLAPRVSA
jgi:hypothetical protein